MLRMKTHKIIITLIGILLIIGGPFFIKSFSGSDASNSTVLITENGFDPKELTISPGTTVSFVNKTKEASWPASNFHPTHELYPEFDIKRPLEPGEKWQFSFKKMGYWGYHDHLNPILTGKIIVSKDRDNNSLEKLSSEPDAKLPKGDAVEKVKQIVKSQGSLAAWEFFKSNYLKQDVQGSHDIAHYIGSLIYQEKNLEGLVKCDSSFAFGCYHGFVEGLIAKEGIDNLSKLVQVCQSFPKHQGQITCYHGIGHGVLSYYKYELKPALNLCDNLLPSSYQQNCYTGVFMENALVNSNKIDKENSMWPCNTVPEKYKSACFKYQMVSLSRLYSDDPVKIAQACSEAEKKEYQESCLQGLGHQISQRHRKEPDEIVRLCGLIEGPNDVVCKIAAAEEFVFQKESFEIARNKICSSLPEPYLEECIKKIEIQRSIQ